jgi:hypothetical protein
MPTCASLSGGSGVLNLNWTPPRVWVKLVGGMSLVLSSVALGRKFGSCQGEPLGMPGWMATALSTAANPSRYES